MTGACSRPHENAHIHRNLKTVGTVGTVGTAREYAGCRRSHPYKRSGNSGNTHHLVSIKAPIFPTNLLFLFPHKNALGTGSHSGGRVIRGVPTVPTVPTCFESQAHMGVGCAVMGGLL